MRILFVMRHAGFTRNFETVLTLLAERGHSIHLVYEIPRDKAEVAERLSREYASVTYGAAPLRADRLRGPARSLRQAIDYLRYLTPAYQNATKLRARARNGTPRWLVGLTALRLARTRPALRVLDSLLRWLERAIPSAENLERFIRETGTDIVFVTPLVAGFSQPDYVRAARRLGLPVVLPVTSWDNLTNKGLVRDALDRVYLWNEAQRREAIELHGLDANSVVAVGAHTYDHWFGWEPTTTREEFCRRVGLDPKRPYLLYVCSSGFICPEERPIVARWLSEIRGHAGPLQEVGVMIRPHPSIGHMWKDNPVANEPNVVVWPPTGANPQSTSSRADYYDSMYHSALVVGINTSALIECAIVGRRTYTMLRPELEATQEGTLHFHHLVRENGGPLVTARSPEEHVAQLAEALTSEDDGWNRPFLEHFVRPYGLETPAAPRMVEDLERFYAAFRPRAFPKASRVARFILMVVCVLTHAQPSLDPGRPWGRRRKKPLHRRLYRLARRTYHFLRLRLHRLRRRVRRVGRLLLRFVRRTRRFVAYRLRRAARRAMFRVLLVLPAPYRRALRRWLRFVRRTRRFRARRLRRAARRAVLRVLLVLPAPYRRALRTWHAKRLARSVRILPAELEQLTVGTEDPGAPADVVAADRESART